MFEISPESDAPALPKATTLELGSIFRNCPIVVPVLFCAKFSPANNK